MHLLYLGGAKGGAIVRLYQSGGYDECKVGCYPYSSTPLFSMAFTFLYTVSLGVVLLCLSIVLAVIATGNKNIIGGADFPTFVYVFFRENKGLYSTLAFCGIVSLFVSAIVRLRKTKQLLDRGVLKMKKVVSLLILFAMIIVLSACSNNLTEKSDIVSLYQKNEEIFLLAAENGDYSAVEGIKGVQKVLVWDTYIDIQCGGAGFGPSTHYYGIFYSADDNLCAIDVAGPRDKLIEQGDGYLYQEEKGDNRYYVEPLGNHFYYYEAHF